MNRKNKPNALIFVWILALFALISMWVSYSSYQREISESATLKSRLFQCSYPVKTSTYPCYLQIRHYMPTPSYQPLIASSFLFMATLLSAIYLTIAAVTQNRNTVTRDFLDSMIGNRHETDLLGEIYHINYLYKQKRIDPAISYLFGVLNDCVQRITKHYGLTPIGYPGEGPVPFNENEHITTGHIPPGSDVWIAQVGWKQNGKTILPSQVSRDADQYLKGDWK